VQLARGTVGSCDARVLIGQRNDHAAWRGMRMERRLLVRRVLDPRHAHVLVLELEMVLAGCSGQRIRRDKRRLHARERDVTEDADADSGNQSCR
jgi:hypothetical protein